MRNMKVNLEKRGLRYDWTGDIVALVLGTMVFAPVVVEWFYWTNSQLGR